MIRDKGLVNQLLNWTVHLSPKVYTYIYTHCCYYPRVPLLLHGLTHVTYLTSRRIILNYTPNFDLYNFLTLLTVGTFRRVKKSKKKKILN